MIESLRKGFQIGLKAARLTKKSVKKELKHLVKKNKITEKQAEMLAKKFMNEIKNYKGSFKKLVDAETKKNIRKIGLISKAEAIRMKKKIIALERELRKKAGKRIKNKIKGKRARIKAKIYSVGRRVKKKASSMKKKYKSFKKKAKKRRHK